MKKLLLLAAVFMMAASFMSCNDNNVPEEDIFPSIGGNSGGGNNNSNNNGNFAAKIVGTWELYKLYDSDSGSWDYLNDSEGVERFIFNTDGTGSDVYISDEGISTIPIRYKLNRAALTIFIEDYTLEFTIISIDSNELVLMETSTKLYFYFKRVSESGGNGGNNSSNIKRVRQIRMITSAGGNETHDFEYDNQGQLDKYVKTYEDGFDRIVTTQNLFYDGSNVTIIYKYNGGNGHIYNNVITAKLNSNGYVSDLIWGYSDGDNVKMRFNYENDYLKTMDYYDNYYEDSMKINNTWVNGNMVYSQITEFYDGESETRTVTVEYDTSRTLVDTSVDLNCILDMYQYCLMYEIPLCHGHKSKNPITKSNHVIDGELRESKFQYRYNSDGSISRITELYTETDFGKNEPFYSITITYDITYY